MRSKSLLLLLIVVLSIGTLAQSQASPQSSGAIYSPDGTRIGERPPGTPEPELKPVPPNTILVKGAWASASDSSTPLPEGGAIVDSVYRNQYFGLSYTVPLDWYQKFQGPPPSDSGYYVLAQLRPNDKFKGTMKGTVLFSAQDLFFNPSPVRNSVELVTQTRDHLQPEYKVERQPEVVKLADRPFVRFDYVAPVAGLHWYVLATQIRCHAVQFIFASQDAKLLDELIGSLNKMKLPAGADPASGNGGGDVPVCIKDYAMGKNLVHKVEPLLNDRKFNPIPVRIIISKTGRVKHIHFLSAFPQQSELISNALLQWEFKPYLENGVPVEVETGIMFGKESQQPVRTKQAVSN